jgi:hypothetical protein
VHRRLVLAAVAAVAAGTVAVTPATAATKAKPWTQTKTMTDPTPDPTGGAIATSDICKGTLPAEAGFTVTIAAPGKLKVTLADFTGDWAVAVRTAAGAFITGDDQNPPDATESATAKLKKAGKYIVQACNLGGTPTATVKMVYTPS